jgi:hypothetical protein
MSSIRVGARARPDRPARIGPPESARPVGQVCPGAGPAPRRAIVVGALPAGVCIRRRHTLVAQSILCIEATFSYISGKGTVPAKQQHKEPPRRSASSCPHSASPSGGPVLVILRYGGGQGMISSVQSNPALCLRQFEQVLSL